MSRAPVHPVTMKIVTATMRTEVKGSIAVALDQLLIACGNSAARAAALEKLQMTHQRITAWEREELAKGDAA